MGTQSRSRSDCHQVTFSFHVCIIQILSNLILIDGLMCVTAWQMESRCQRSKDESRSLQTAYPAVCVHQEERLWGMGHSWGWWLLHVSLLIQNQHSDVFLRLTCLFVCVCFVGHGRCRGAGLAHVAAGVLGRGVEFVGCPGNGESENP